MDKFDNDVENFHNNEENKIGDVSHPKFHFQLKIPNSNSFYPLQQLVGQLIVFKIKTYGLDIF